MQMDNFRGELRDISAEKTSLLLSERTWRAFWGENLIHRHF